MKKRALLLLAISCLSLLLRAQPMSDSLREAGYRNWINSGANVMMNWGYEQAKKDFNEALKLKPGDWFALYLLDQLENTDGGMQRDAFYASMIKKGDDAFKNKKFIEAQLNYQEALKYKPSEQYPKDQILACGRNTSYNADSVRHVIYHLDSLLKKPAAQHDDAQVLDICRQMLLLDPWQFLYLQNNYGFIWKNSASLKRDISNMLVKKGDQLSASEASYFPENYYRVAVQVDPTNPEAETKLKSYLHFYDSLVFVKEHPPCEEWFGGMLKTLRTYTGFKSYLEKDFSFWGELQSERYVSNGTMDSMFSYSRGKKTYEAHLKNGKLDGRQVGWFENGVIRQDALWENGKLVGTAKYFDANGKLLSESTQPNDSTETETTYYGNGNKKEYNQWIHNVPLGKHTEWYENGNKKFETTYKANGGYAAPTTYWYENGNKEKEESDTMLTEWYKNGMKKREKNFSNGSSQCWDETGKPRTCTEDQIEYSH